jgi:AGCS family alanine or glycine:cation symporter
VFLIGERAVLTYKLLYCGLIVVATTGFIRTDVELDNLTSLGTGVMLLANIPIIWIFGKQTMRAYHDYVGRLKSGKMGPGHAAPPLDEVISGRDVD